MNQSIRNAVLVVLAVSVPAFAQGKSTEKNKMMSLDEKGLLERLHMANQHEITAGNMAMQKASNDATKQAAQMIVSDHEQADQDVMALAKKKNLKLGAPTPMNEMEKTHKAMM